MRRKRTSSRGEGWFDQCHETLRFTQRDIAIEWGDKRIGRDNAKFGPVGHQLDDFGC